MSHPSKSLEARQNGFGVAAGIEKPYDKKDREVVDKIASEEKYASVPHSGYYGTGLGARPFKKGQASFNDEMSWYKVQYGEVTSKK
jgi:hypothetical protein